MNNFGQLILFGSNVLREDVYAKEKYILSKSNEQLVRILSDFSHWKTGKFLILTGERYSGRTHSCHFFAEMHNGFVINHITCDMVYDPDLLSTIDCIAIDNLEDFEELVLFHILNYLRMRKVFVLLTCRNVDFRIPDLHSRLISIPRISIEKPDIPLAEAIFFKMLSDYDIQLDDKILEYVKSRLPQDFEPINRLIDDLRNTIFVKKQRITMVKIKSMI